MCYGRGADSLSLFSLFLCDATRAPATPPPPHTRSPSLRPFSQRQVQVHGHKVSIEEMSRLIDAVTLDDVYRVANRVIRPKQSAIVADHKRSGRPTIVAQGRLGNMPDVMTFLRRRGLA